MTNTTEVLIEYTRPGKDVQHFLEDLWFQDEHRIKTYKVFPGSIAERLTHSLQDNGFISKQQRTTCITKIYFFQEHFDLLQFHDENDQVLGTYSDIGTPLIRTDRGYQMTDWFLDIWLSPNGRLFELDMDEFQDGLSKNLISQAEADIALATFARLLDEVKQGVYPNAYLQ